MSSITAFKAKAQFFVELFENEGCTTNNSLEAAMTKLLFSLAADFREREINELLRAGRVRNPEEELEMDWRQADDVAQELHQVAQSGPAGRLVAILAINQIQSQLAEAMPPHLDRLPIQYGVISKFRTEDENAFDVLHGVWFKMNMRLHGHFKRVFDEVVTGHCCAMGILWKVELRNITSSNGYQQAETQITQLVKQIQSKIAGPTYLSQLMRTAVARYNLLGEWFDYQMVDPTPLAQGAVSITSAPESDSVSAGSVDNSVAAAVLNGAFSMPDQKFYVAPGIPETKLDKFVEAYQKNAGRKIAKETVLLYFDETLLGGGDEGVAVTRDGVHVRTGSAVTFVPFREMSQAASVSGWFNKTLTLVGASTVKFLLTQGNKGAEALLAAINRGYAAFRSQTVQSTLSDNTPALVTTEAQSTGQPNQFARDTVDVILLNPGRDKIGIIKLIREITGLGLREAKDLVDSAPQPVVLNQSPARAREVSGLLIRAGGTVEIK